MTKKRTGFIKGNIILLVILLAAFAVAGVWKIFSRETDGALTRIVIAQAGDFFLYAPLYVALDGGFLADEGLDVSLITTGGDDKTWAAVIGKSAHFGIADPTFVAIADEKGSTGKIIGGLVNGVPFWGVTFKPEIEIIRSGIELRPYVVATFPLPSTAYTLQRKMFNDAGLEARIREGAFGSLVAMLRSGQADIALELEPNVSQVVKDSGRVVYSLSNLYGDFAITGIMASTDFLDQKPELAQKLLNGLQRALNAIHADQEKALAILTKRFPEIDKNVARTALLRVTDENILPESLEISPDAWSKAVQLRIDVGDLTSAKQYSTYIDGTFARNAFTSVK